MWRDVLISLIYLTRLCGQKKTFCYSVLRVKQFRINLHKDSQSTRNKKVIDEVERQQNGGQSGRNCWRVIGGLRTFMQSFVIY